MVFYPEPVVRQSTSIAFQLLSQYPQHLLEQLKDTQSSLGRAIYCPLDFPSPSQTLGRMAVRVLWQVISDRTIRCQGSMGSGSSRRGMIPETGAVSLFRSRYAAD